MESVNDIYHVLCIVTEDAYHIAREWYYLCANHNYKNSEKLKIPFLLLQKVKEVTLAVHSTELL